MAFTSADLASVESAIVDLASGVREVQVSVRDKMIRYTETSLNDLMRLKSIIERDINGGSPAGMPMNKVRFDSAS